MCSEVSKLEQHDLQVCSQDWPKGGVLISNMGIRQGPLQNQGGCFSTPRPSWLRPWSFYSWHKCTLINRFTQYPGLLQLCGLHNRNSSVDFFPKTSYCNVHLPLENRRVLSRSSIGSVYMPCSAPRELHVAFNEIDTATMCVRVHACAPKLLLDPYFSAVV